MSPERFVCDLFFFHTHTHSAHGALNVFFFLVSLPLLVIPVDIGSLDKDERASYAYVVQVPVIRCT